MRKIKTKNILIVFCFIIICLIILGNFPKGKAIKEESRNENFTYKEVETYYSVQQNIKSEKQENISENNNFENELFTGNINFYTLEEISENKYKKKNIDTNDIVFIGNSLVEGLKIYSNDENVYLCKTGISLNGLKTDIYKKMKNYNCNNVIIGMGTNELGYYSEEKFKNSYMDLINHIYSINKNATIICLSIPPVSKNKSDNSDFFNNNNVKLYNQYIKELCNKNKLYYIDNNEFFGDVLDTNWTGDGIHFKSEIYKNWYNFIIDKILNM